MSPAYCLQDFVDNHIFTADLPSNEPRWPICYESWEDNEQLQQLIISTECHHDYHYECLLEWLCNNNRTCPTCRRQLIQNGDDPLENGYEPLWEELPLTSIHEDAERYVFLFGRYYVEQFVHEKLLEIGFNELDTHTRFNDNLDSILEYVVRKWREWFTGPLWDPLPRRIPNIDDSAIATRAIIALLMRCGRRSYLERPMTTEEHSFLAERRRAHWLAHSRRWDVDEREFVLHGLVPCFLRIKDFFTRRHCSDIPVRSVVKIWDACYDFFYILGESNIAKDYREEVQLHDQNDQLPVRTLFVDMLMSTRGTIQEVEIKESGRLSSVTFYCNVDGWFRQREVEFFYEEPKADLLN